MSKNQNASMAYRTHYNVSEHNNVGEINHEPSLTVPDQNFTVKELLQRQQQGLPVFGEKVPVYNGEDLLPDFNRLDLAELEELRRQAHQRIIDLRSQAISENEAHLQKLKDEYLQKLQNNEEPELPAPPSGAKYPKKTRGQGAEPLPPEELKNGQS